MVEIINGVKNIKKLNIGKGSQSTPVNKASGLQSTPISIKKVGTLKRKNLEKVLKYSNEKKNYIIIYNGRVNQIIQLLNNENTTFKNISYKSVDRVKLNNTNNNGFSNNKFTFNTKSIASQLVLYKDAYILLEVDIKFGTEANALLTNLRLKNSYEMVNSLKIQPNNYYK